MVDSVPTAASTCCASAPWTIATFGRFRIRRRRLPPISASRRSWRCHVRRCHPPRPRPTTLLPPPETSHRSVSFKAFLCLLFFMGAAASRTRLHCSAALSQLAPPRARASAGRISRPVAPDACCAAPPPASVRGACRLILYSL